MSQDVIDLQQSIELLDERTSKLSPWSIGWEILIDAKLILKKQLKSLLTG